MTGRVEARTCRRDAAAALFGDSRGQRFARRHVGLPTPTLGDVVGLPDWIAAAPTVKSTVATVAGLLVHRSAFDRELSGPRLAALADAFGETLIDAVCSAEIEYAGEPGASLLMPAQVTAAGQNIIERALPPSFAGRYPAAAGDRAAYALSLRAIAVARSAGLA